MAKSFSGTFPDSTEHTTYELVIENESGESYQVNIDGHLARQIFNLGEGN